MNTRAGQWSVVLPYFNEANFLPATLESLLAQELRPLQLILVDNASTDDTTARCHALLDGRTDVQVVYLHEPRPGKTNALETGLAHVDTEFVAFCDADTYYPPHYLKRCNELFAESPADVLAVMAQRVSGPPHLGWGPRFRMIKTLVWSKIFPKQCLTGGFGQSFRTESLRAAGGFSIKLWPYVFEDHEVMQRLFKIGRSRYDFNLWCIPSMRRSGARSAVDWTPFEKRLYGITPYLVKDWFFYSFLAKRFEARRQYAVVLREQNWHKP